MTQPTTTQAKPPGDAKQQAHEAKAGNGRKRGRPAGADAKVWDYTGLDAAFLGKPEGVSDTLASMAAPVRARDERQIAMDKIVSQVREEWNTKGQPQKWSQMPKRSYHVDPKAADTLRMLVRRAAAFHGYSAKFGKPVRDQQGREIVVFAVRDARKRETKTDDATFTLEELRAFVTDFFTDDTEGAEEFLAQLTGEAEPEEEGEE